MAKKFDESILFKRMEEEKAAREEREAKAKIDWRKKLKLMPWQTLKDVDLPDEFYESLLIKIRNLDTRTSYFKTISDIIALSIDYEQYSEDWDLAMKYMYLKFQLPDGKISPLLPAVVSSMIEIATKDAREKKIKTMKEWRETMESLTEKMLPQDDNKLEMNSEVLSLKLRISELEGKLREAESLDKHRIEEIDKWYGSYEHAMTEKSMWQQKYDESKDEVSNLTEKDRQDVYPLLGVPQIILTNNSNFARVVQAMVSARYFKRANGDETNATEVGGMLLKLFGVSNTWKSVLQKAYSRENPLKTFDELRDAGEKYWTNRTGLTKEIRKKGKNKIRYT